MSAARSVLAEIQRSPLAIFGVVVLLVLVLVAVLGPWISPHDPMAGDIRLRLRPPIWQDGALPEHLLGTDAVGRDVLSRLISGAQLTLLIGVSASAFAAIFGIALGLLAGYHGGWLSTLIMRVADLQLAFPSILLYIAVLALWGAGIPNLILVLAITNWVIYARVLHGSVLSIREREYVEAARAIGHRHITIMLRHILPSAIGPLTVVASFSVGSMVIAESTLSFLGLGVPPSVPTWGGMLADGRDYLTQAWWLSTLPGIAILLVVLSFNVLGDALRDWLDPRTRGR